MHYFRAILSTKEGVSDEEISSMIKGIVYFY